MGPLADKGHRFLVYQASAVRASSARVASPIKKRHGEAVESAWRGKGVGAGVGVEVGVERTSPTGGGV